MKRAAAERAAETAQVRLAKAEYYAQKKENPSEAVQKGLAKLRERVLKLDDKVSKIMATIDEKMSSGEHGRSTSAFVTYETETAKDKCAKLYKPGNLYAWFFRPKKLRFQGHRMWVHVAPEGSDVIWENLDVVGLNALVRRALAWLAMIIVLCVTGAAVRLFEIAPKLPPARHLMRDAQARRHPRVRQDLDHHRRDRSGVQGRPRQPARVFRSS